ncbi:hypothetical protein [Pontibacter pamirensis]|uniref:hypothetical protein n=1 Tax=Pontibacter pamirensis TaxID=2562824 RepID=UPI001389A74F|nr:hypothetical protein [Pontibacter pamirensis]
MVFRFNVKAALSTVFISIISLTTAFSQEVKFIELEYSTAVRPDNAHVKVYISQGTGSSYSLKVESSSLWLKLNPESLKPEVKPKEKEITITEEQFQKIINSVQSIKQADLIGGPHPSLLDGSSCSVSFGTLGSSISYQVNTPTYETDKRKLSDYMKAYKLILETAKLDPDSILD